MAKSDKNADGPKGGGKAYNVLLGQILNGELLPGSRLPIEQELAEQYGIARSTLRRALDRLRKDELIISRQGDGHYVAGFAAGDRLEMHIGVNCTFEDLFEVRKNLDGMAAAHAAMNRTQECLDEMSDAINAMRAEIGKEHINLVNIRRIDIEFHQTIASCSNNALLRGLIEAHAAALGPYWIMWMKLDEAEGRSIVRRTLKEHNLIFAAIEAGNSVAAESAMRSHFMTSLDRQKSINMHSKQ
jgi:GntR family transcriptional regulator, transcriptional repressor for pyruvate dehydrogenase complex